MLGLLDPATAVVQDRLGTRVPGPAAGGVIGVIDLTLPWTSVAEVNVDVANNQLRFSGSKTDMKVSGGYITVGDFDSYEWRVFDRTGRLIRHVSRRFEEMIGYPVADEQSPPYSLDLFDAEGRFLFSLENSGDAPTIGSPTAVGPDGRLYTRVLDPFPPVRRYRVEIEEQ